MLKLILLIGTLSVVHGQGGDDSKDRYLTLPIKELCDNRFMEAKYKGRNFFYSGHDPSLKDERFDWLDARNTCRNRCMETVSFEDQEKFDFYKGWVAKQNLTFFWTSGRICDFEGCEGRWDLLPKRIKGWLWSANQVPIPATNKKPPGWTYQPWSFTGINKKPQPDNAGKILRQGWRQHRIGSASLIHFISIFVNFSQRFDNFARPCWCSHFIS